MYRDRLIEIKGEKGISTKQWSKESGISIDTINRIIHPENPDKDSPRVSTLEELLKPLGVELWELFYTGDKSFVHIQSELASLKAERDNLLIENASLKTKNECLSNKVDSLKDRLLDFLPK